ncbi:MAG: 3-deoxy-D-manno-octulosonic acid transferase [Chitinophagaceae bacterium]|nr:3-deoxy-D-manno-octulosonic acid transferase [Chitinophagaceae bacterium]
MSKIIYRLFVFFYNAALHLASFWNSKARLWVQGRKQLLEKIKLSFEGNSSPVIWMHAASLGEFEQGRPVITQLKSIYPDYKIVITFFSPSGYENKKNYTGADYIFYLPADSEINARKFISIIKPSLVIWVKYEFWFHYLSELKKRDIPVVLISALFRPGQPFFKFYGSLWRNMLLCFKAIFVQNQQSAELLKTIGIEKNVTVSGDTRFDSVINTAENFAALPGLIKLFCGSQKVVVAGSTWAEDEEELLHFVKNNKAIKFIIAPHETAKSNIEEVQTRFTGCLLYSQLTESNVQTGNVLVIDNIGMLSRLYKYAHITYVGGGFGDDGLHNILEAAVYGKPVIFGPNYEKFPEATDLIAYGGAISVENTLELEKVLNNLITSDELREGYAAKAKLFIYNNKGATEKIISFITR